MQIDAGMQSSIDTTVGEVLSDLRCFLIEAHACFFDDGTMWRDPRSQHLQRRFETVAERGERMVDAR
ncbi:hypothetical protein ACFQS6_20305 [Xanthomonas populi]